MSKVFRSLSLLTLACSALSAQAATSAYWFTGTIETATSQEEGYQQVTLNPNGAIFTGKVIGNRIWINSAFGSANLPALFNEPDFDDVYTYGGYTAPTATGFTSAFDEFYASYSDLNLGLRKIYYITATSESVSFYHHMDVDGNFASGQSFEGTVTRFKAISAPGPMAALPFALMTLKRRKRA